MSDQRYPVIDVELSSSELESMGSRRKFWITREDGIRWLLKFPRPQTGEHWAEKIAAEIGRLIQVNVARVELARFEDQQVTVCKSFIQGEDDESYASQVVKHWLHGYQVLEQAILGYNAGPRFRNTGHGLKNISTAIARMASDAQKSPERLMEDLASFALLDGLIGNTDRHHENWIVMYARDATSGSIDVCVAPSFDHASSLGRELRDERRERYLDSPTGVLNYLKRGRGGVFVDSNRTRAPSPLHLARVICRWRPELGRTWFNRLNSVTNTETRSAIDKVPAEFMSDTAREFAYQVVIASKAELLRSVR